MRGDGLLTGYVEDIIKRCAERDTLLERMSALEAQVGELQARNEELEKMLSVTAITSHPTPHNARQ
jgi:hypothetical protein